MSTESAISNPYVGINFKAVPGNAYAVEATSDWIVWREAGTVVADQNPMAIQLACDCMSGTEWFYRVKAR